MGSNLGLTRLYGRAAPGQRVLDQVPRDRGGHVSTRGALGLNGMRTGLRVPGAVEGATRLFFVEDLLVPTLNRGDIVVMDNNPSHKPDEIEDAMAAGGLGSCSCRPMRLTAIRLNSAGRKSHPARGRSHPARSPPYSTP
jgi:DDE superfamily endonuclease